MALPLFLYGYCVLASNLNSPNSWVDCHEMNGTFSLHHVNSFLFCFVLAFSSCFPQCGEFLKEGDHVSTIRFSSSLGGGHIFLSDWELPNKRNQCPLCYFRSFSKGHLSFLLWLPLWFPSGFCIFSFHKYLLRFIIMCQLLFQAFCSWIEWRLEFLLKDLTFSVGGGKRDRQLSR